jgi:ribosomal-protein-alanine N-acetyltransferase
MKPPIRGSDMLSRVSFRPPPIVTERLVLRGYEEADAPNIFRYGSDEETTQFMFWERSRTLDDTLAFLNGLIAPHYEQGELDYGITLKGDDKTVVGGMSAYWNPRAHQVMELGYILRKDLWGQGLIVEAGRALIAHAFATTDVERIFAPIFAPNVKSRRAAEKMGMKLDGVLRSKQAVRGRRWDEAVYSRLRGE